MSAVTAQPSTREALALLLETACRDFEALQRLLRHETRLVNQFGQEDHHAAAATRMALAKSFIFYLVRARRILDQGKSRLAEVTREERARFLANTASAEQIRDVNEHGYDLKNNYSQPSMHRHREHDVILDETSLVVIDSDHILMGKVNLYRLYLPTDRMRQLAGCENLSASKLVAAEGANGR
jgi:hypothetical protein